MSDTLEALNWIHTLTQQLDAPTQFCGGLAAIGYGSKRPLNDIDLFVPNSHFCQVVQMGADYIVKPASHYRESAEGWDLVYVQFLYKNTKIEVGNSKGAKIFDQQARTWVNLVIDYNDSVYMPVFNISIPLMPASELIHYKKRLGRAVDLEDIGWILQKSN